MEIQKHFPNVGIPESASNRIRAKKNFFQVDKLPRLPCIRKLEKRVK